MDKSILEVVHGGAKNLHEAGLVDAITMREFDSLCLPPIKQFTAAQIKGLRLQTKTSQGVFAAYLNTSKTTVQKWEQGAKRPSGASLKLINLVEQKGLEVLA
jgi:putative transcriptional regulator